MNNIYEDFNKIILNGKEINMNNISKEKQKQVKQSINNCSISSFTIIKELRKICELIKETKHIKAVVVADSHPEYAFSTNYIITREGDVFKSKSNNIDMIIITKHADLKEILINSDFVFNIYILNIDELEKYNLGSNFLRILTGGTGWGGIHDDTIPYEEIKYLICNKLKTLPWWWNME